MSINLKKLLILLGTFLYPIYFLPWVFKLMLKNEELGYILFSLLMAYLGYTMIPYNTMDIVRHYEKFELLSTIDFDQVINETHKIFYLVFNFYMWLISHIGFKKEFVPFSLVFIQYMLYFSVLKNIIIWSKKRNEMLPFWIRLLGIIFIIIGVRFISTASGLRNGLAFSIFIYALFKLFINKDKIKFYSLSILAISVHIAVLPLFLIFIISKYIDFKTTKRILFIMSLLLLISGTSSIIFYTIIGLLKPFLKSYGLYFHAYMDPDGLWGSNFYANKNIKTIIMEKIIQPLPFYLSGFYLLKVKKMKYLDMQSYLYLLYIFIAFVSVSRTLLDRYDYFFVLFFMFVVLIEMNREHLSNFKKVFLGLFIAALLLINMGAMVKYRDLIISWHPLFYIPVPYMLMKSVKPDEYIQRESLNF